MPDLWFWVKYVGENKPEGIIYQKAWTPNRTEIDFFLMSYEETDFKVWSTAHIYEWKANG